MKKSCFTWIKGKLKMRNLMWALFLLFFAILMIVFAVDEGFSTEAHWRLGLKGIDGGIPIPSWLLSSVGVLLGCIFLYFVYDKTKSFICDDEYKKLIKTAEQFGHPEEIDSLFSEVGKNPHVKGADLWCCRNFLLYFEGLNVFLVKADTVRKIEPSVGRNRNSVTYGVNVYYDGDKAFRIKTTKKQLKPLFVSMADLYPDKIVLPR